MDSNSGSVTLAYLIVGASLVIKHGWISAFKQWATNPVTPNQTISIGPADINDWQAAIITYVILMLLSETESLGSIAVALAWAIGIIEGISAMTTLQTAYPNLFQANAKNATQASGKNTPPPIPQSSNPGVNQ